MHAGLLIETPGPGSLIGEALEWIRYDIIDLSFARKRLIELEDRYF